MTDFDRWLIDDPMSSIDYDWGECDCPSCTGEFYEVDSNRNTFNLDPDDYCEGCGRSHDVCDCYEVN